MKFDIFAIDVQDVSEKINFASEEELALFANELFWQDDDIDFSNSSLKEIAEVCEGCDYIVYIQTN